MGNDDIRIVVLQRGWVMVGKYSQDGDRCCLDSAHVIRRWGTSEGLGQLVAGPLPNTKLDPAGHVEFHALGVIATIACEAAKWTPSLA
jgi:hypothetical protein